MLLYYSITLLLFYSITNLLYFFINLFQKDKQTIFTCNAKIRNKWPLVCLPISYRYSIESENCQLEILQEHLDGQMDIDIYALGKTGFKCKYI